MIFREAIEKRQAEEIASTICSSQRGFTLIEIAIVLIIIGILIALGATLIGPLTKRAKYNETKDIVSAAVESVISYGASNKKLPLQGDFTPDSTIDEFVEVVRNPRDAWTKTLYYVVDTNLTTIPPGSTDAICGRKTTDLIVCRDVNCTDANKITNVAFAVISGADNYNIQTGIITGGTCPSGQTCVRVYDVDTPDIDDCTNPTNCPNYPAGEMISRAEPYDDIVKWVTLDELRIKAGCVGPQLEIVNNDLPVGFRDATVYDAAVFAEGGVPFNITNENYRWCIQRTPAVVPANLSFRNTAITANIVFSTACSALTEASWTRSNTVVISGSPNLSGSFNLTFFVRDNNDPAETNDNIAQKLFVLTIHQVARSTGCAGFRVWNGIGAKRDFMLDGVCSSVGNNAEITNDPTIILLNFGEIIQRFSSTNGTCVDLIDSITFNQAVNADAVDNNCRVNYETTGVTNR